MHTLGNIVAEAWRHVGQSCAHVCTSIMACVACLYTCCTFVHNYLARVAILYKCAHTGPHVCTYICTRVHIPVHNHFAMWASLVHTYVVLHTIVHTCAQTVSAPPLAAPAMGGRDVTGYCRDLMGHCRGVMGNVPDPIAHVCGFR